MNYGNITCYKKTNRAIIHHVNQLYFAGHIWLYTICLCKSIYVCVCVYIQYIYVYIISKPTAYIELKQTLFTPWAASPDKRLHFRNKRRTMHPTTTNFCFSLCDWNTKSELLFGLWLGRSLCLEPCYHSQCPGVELGVLGSWISGSTPQAPQHHQNPSYTDTIVL